MNIVSSLFDRYDHSGITLYLAGATLAAAALAAAMLLWFLFTRPVIGWNVKILLFFGIGVLPITAAVLGNVAGYEVSKRRQFCGDCHTMKPFTNDAANPASESLAALHSRNKQFGLESCYTCHRDYTMFGTVTTKISGLHDLWSYYTEFAWLKPEEAKKRLHLRKPFPVGNCTQCHSTTLPIWKGIKDHEDVSAEGDQNAPAVCLDCHGPIHISSGGATK